MNKGKRNFKICKSVPSWIVPQPAKPRTMVRQPHPLSGNVTIRKWTVGEPVFSDTTQRNNEGESFEKYLSMTSTELNITNRPSILVCFQRKPKLGEDKESLDKGCTGCESATIVFCPLPTTNKTENFLKRSRSRTKQNFLLTTNFPGFIRRIFSPENQQLLSL